MVQEYIALLPKQAPTGMIPLLCTVTVIGAGLWLLGSRYSRALVTLSMVALGVAGGLWLPRWMQWSIGGMATAVAGALVLGLLAFVLHRLWVAVGLGLLLAAWAGAGTWLSLIAGREISWPSRQSDATLAAYAKDCWAAFPEDFQRVMPFASTVAWISATAAGIMWPRIGSAVFYSLLGATLMTMTGLGALALGRPTWIDVLPGTTYMQIAILVAMVALGAAVQYFLTGTRSKPKKQPASEETIDQE